MKQIGSKEFSSMFGGDGGMGEMMGSGGNR
jgi:hypothetical protein